MTAEKKPKTTKTTETKTSTAKKVTTPAVKKTVEKKTAPAAHHTIDDAKVVVKKKSEEKNVFKKGVQYYGTGRRKNAVARVFLVPGDGKIMVNEKEALEYLDNRMVLLSMVNKPLIVVGLKEKYNVVASVHGGGKAGQAGAVSHGIARAIIEINPDLKKMLKIEGLITRDSRIKEAKKYGRKKARKGYTFRKR